MSYITFTQFYTAYFLIIFFYINIFTPLINSRPVKLSYTDFKMYKLNVFIENLEKKSDFIFLKLENTTVRYNLAC